MPAAWEPGPPVRAEEVAVPMRDGCRLATDVVRPGAPGQWPVMLVRTPYGRSPTRTGLDVLGLARDGMAVVVQDVRGRWDSAGDYRPLVQDIADGEDAVAWCAEQPWSTGAVVMGGASYDGMTAWLAAMGGPPALRAIAPVVSTPYTAEAVFADHGATNLGFLVNWGFGHAKAGNHLDRAAEERATRLVETWPDAVRRPGVLDELAEIFPPYAAWRRDRSLLPGLTPGLPPLTTGLPVHQITGWWDVFVEGALRAHRQLAETGAPQRLVVGPWAHGDVFATQCGDLDFPPTAGGFDRFVPERARFLADASAGAPLHTGVTVFVLGADEWRDLPSWPPPSVPRLLAADADGRLVDGRAGRSAVLRWRHDPDDPVPTLGGRTLHPGRATPGPRDRTALRQRPDVLTLATEPLPGPVTIIGTVTAELIVEADTPTTDLTLTLVDEQRERAIGLVTTTTRVDSTAGALRATFDVGSIAVRLAAGHRLALDIASSDVPRHDATRPGGRRVVTGLTLALPTLPQ